MRDPSGFLTFVGADGATAGLACAAKAAGVLAVAGLAARGMRGRSAAARHLAWCLGLAGALAVPPLSLAVPRWGVPILAGPAAAVSPPVGPAAPVAAVDAPAGPARILPAAPVVACPAATAVTAPPPPSRPIAPGSRLLAAWAAGSAAVLAWQAVGWAAVWRLGRRAARVEDRAWREAAEGAAARLGVRHQVRLVRGGPGAMPLTWGVLRPTVLVPATADAWPADLRRVVLMHELAHVRRRDCLTQWLGMAACAAYWFNPLAWMAAGRLRAERELACDDLVLEAGERPSDYAAQLLGVARSLRPAPATLHPALAMARPSGLERRLVAILAPGRARRGPARWLAAAGLLAALAASATLAAAWPVTPAPDGRAVAGRVVGADGEPLAGASVVLLAARPDPWNSPAPDDSRPLGRATSDAAGAFRIELDERAKPDDPAVLVAAAPGRAFASRRLADPAAPLAEPLRLAAERPAAIRLVDLQGAPVAGAEVRLLEGGNLGQGDSIGRDELKESLLPELARPVVADAEGRFTLRGFSPGGLLVLDIRAPGFGRQRHDWQNKADAPEGTIALGRAHVIEGRVTLGPNGPPAAGARVRARSMSTKEGIGMHRGDAEADADADGRYRVEVASGASVRVVVDPPREGADAYLIRGRLVVPTEAAVAREDFALPRGVLVAGRVTEEGTGRPVAGAVVHHKAHERNNPYFIAGTAAFFNGDEQKAVTAADGTYRLAVMPGPGYLLAKGPTDDYLHREVSAIDLSGELIWPNNRHYPDAFRKLDSKPGDDPLDVDLTFRRGITVGGRVLDPDGRPDRDATVFTRWNLSPTSITVNNGQRVVAARGGRFALAGCDPEAPGAAYFLDPARQLGAMVEVPGKQAGRDLDVTLQPCGSATVRLLDGQGKPLPAGRAPAHLEVALSPGASFADIFTGNPDDRTSPLMADAIHVANLDRERYRDLKLDAVGRLTFPTLIPGATYRVVVYNQPARTQVEFAVRPGEAKDLGDLRIPKPDRAR